MKLTIKKTIFLLSAFISAIGFADAAYLIIKYYRGIVPRCSIVDGCEKVLTSPYATIFGIPVALFGVLMYAIIFMSSLLYYGTGAKRFLWIYGAAVIIAFSATLYFLYIQFFVLNALCLYCLISAIASITLFILGMIYLLLT